MDWREGILAYVGTGVAAVLIFPRCTEVISRAQDTHERIVLSRKRTTGPPPLVPCPQSESKGARNSLRGIAIIGALIGFIQFYNALDNDLVFDDHLAIRNNPIISRSNTTLYDVWVHDFWGKPLKDVSSHKSWRPLTTLSFKLNVLYNGGFDAASMHLTNNMLHAAVCALLAYVAYDLFRCCTTTFYAVVLFAVHPVHVEAVTGVVARSECLCALFYLLGIIAFRRAASLSYLACVVLALLSKETGLSLIGIAIVHDFVVAGGVLECVQGRDPLWTGLLPCAESSNEQDMVRHARKLRLARLWARAWFFLCFCVHAATVALYIMCRLTLMVDHTDSNSSWRDMTLSTSRLIRRSENPYTFLNGTSKVLSYAFLQTKYAELLLLPREFSCEYSYDCIPAVTTYADPRNFASLALILAVLYFLYSLLTWSNNSPRIVATIATKAGGECPGDKNVVGKATGDSRSSNDDDDGSPQTTCGPEIRRSTKIHGTSHAGISHPEAAARAICFAMIVVPFLPASGLLTRIGTLVAERLLYLPSMGVCLLVGRMLATAAGQPMLQFSTSTEDYASTQLETNKTAGQVDTSVPSAPVEMGTSSADLSFGMGRKTLVLAMFGGMTAYFASTTWVRTQDWRTDETLFKSALSVCPRSAKIHQQYGQIMMNHATPHDPTAYSSAAERTEALHEAERHFKVAQDIDPQFCDLDFNFAMVASMRQDYGTAAALFRKSLPCVYSNQRAFINLQLLWNSWLQGGQNVSVHKDMAEVFEMMEKKDESVIHWRECGVISLQAGKMKAAEQYFAEALRVIPDRCDIRYWQGKMYLGHAERSSKKKPTRKRLAKIDVWTTRGIESLEYCAQKRCKDSQGACIAELIKLYPSLLTSGSDRFDSLVPDAKQATLSRNFSSALLKVVDHPMVKQVAATSDLYRRISLFHRVRSGAMFALMGKLSDAIGAFDDIVLDKSNIPEQGGVMRCVVYQWIAVAAQEMYDATGDTKHFENAKQAREMVTQFSPHIRRAAAPLSEGVDDEPELAEIVRSGLRNPELARFMELTARATSKQNK